MKLIFLGTRGNIEARTRRHNKHSSLCIVYRRRRVMIDCGLDWLGKIGRVAPDAIIITHAHPDHADGLKKGASCPVYATKDSWQVMRRFPIDDKRIVKPYRPLNIAGITFKAFPVVHSLRAPAVGYRVTAGKATFFYVPDLISIVRRKAALANVQIYIGDGATIVRPIVRMRGDIPMGHTTIKAQLQWCQKEGISRAIFTHCGSQLVKGDERVLGAKVRAIAKECGVRVSIAHDGMEVLL